MRYGVVVVSNHTWQMDGSPVVERCCGHQHRTIRGAVRCLRKLRGYDPKTQTWNAAWHRAEVRGYDEHNMPVAKLDGKELDELIETR